MKHGNEYALKSARSTEVRWPASLCRAASSDRTGQADPLPPTALKLIIIRTAFSTLLNPFAPYSPIAAYSFTTTMEHELGESIRDAQRPLANSVRPTGTPEQTQMTETEPDATSSFQKLFKSLKLLCESFYRHENAKEGAWNQAIATTPWIRELRPRHIVFIPLAGTIGT